MLRITSGSAKNKKLKIPNTPNFRGVQEIAKLAIFSILGEKITSSKCLDLYAGSGNLGIEALSRGAKWCDFVEDNRSAEKAIEENLKNCNLEKKAEVFGQDAVKYVANTHQKYDVIFVDPFYDNLSHRFLMKNIEDTLHKNGIIFFTHGKDLNMEKQIEGTNLCIESQRRYGRSYLSILSKSNPGG